MVRVSEPLCTERYTGNEFKSASVFNKDTDFDSLNKRIQEHIKESKNKRSKTQKKYNYIFYLVKSRRLHLQPPFVYTKCVKNDTIFEI